MSDNFYEAELRVAMRAMIGGCDVRETGDSASFFATLAKAYPSLGSKIDWNRVAGSIERSEKDETLQIEIFLTFFDEMKRQFQLVGDVVYIGDSATDFSLTGSIECMKQLLPELLAIPQHHYFIGADFSWCLCFSMEGDMGFGLRPSPESC